MKYKCFRPCYLGEHMKKLISIITAICIVILVSSACSHIPNSNLVDKNRDEDGYIQFIAEFNTGLFVYTNNPNSELRYYPNNSKLEKTFSYGSFDLEFSANYQGNKIVYTVNNPVEDRIWEAKTFADIYGVYYSNWNNFATKTDVGSLNISEENDTKTIELIISGLSYTVTFMPYAQVPTIIYEVTEIA